MPIFFEQTIQTVSNFYHTKGTSYLFDRSSSNTSVQVYQRNLAQIIAITQPVEKDCNPITFVQYYWRYAWSVSIDEAKRIFSSYTSPIKFATFCVCKKS